MRPILGHCFLRGPAMLRSLTTSRGGAAVFALLACFAVPQLGNAKVTERVLHSFSGCGVDYCVHGDLDGMLPTSSLVADPAGNLYGTTTLGGLFAGNTGCYPYTCSTVFKLTRAGSAWKKTTIYYFKGINAKLGLYDGSYTASGLLWYRGALYGTTYQGGRFDAYCGGGCGTAYRLTPPAAGKTLWNEEILWNFTGNGDAGVPESSLVADSGGALYGTYLGDNFLFANGAGLGGAFKLMPPAAGNTHWTEQVISTLGAGTVGQQLVAPLIFDERGNLYGVAKGAVYNGVPSSVFELVPQNAGRTRWKTVILHQFSPTGIEGTFPMGGVVMNPKNGHLFTTTSVGAGAGCIHRLGCGTVFELSPPATGNGPWNVHVLHTFTGEADGGNSQAGLTIDAAGNLYGTTQNGGYFGNSSLGSGAVFEVFANGEFHVVYRFEGWCCSNPIYGKPNHDGLGPFATPLIWDGSLFGTTRNGGTDNDGAVYEITP